MTFFVKYNGDLDRDPLDFGVKDFADYESAFEFAEKMTNKGLATTIYSGTIMEMKYQATLAERHKKQNEFLAVWNFVIKNGTLVHRAKSAWGSDRWECDELIASLYDEGYTRKIISPKIAVREDCFGKLIFKSGTERDLKELFDSIKEQP